MEKEIKSGVDDNIDDYYDDEEIDIRKQPLSNQSDVLEQKTKEMEDQLTQKKIEIQKMAKDLKGGIRNLDQAIQDILDKQHKEYLSTFSTFMDSIRSELTSKIEEMEKMVEEKKKANDLRLIRCERDFFRLEAVRLNGICKTFKEKIDEITFRNKLLSDEVNTLTTKWKESENVNKQLLFELESNITSYKELEANFNETKELLNKKNINTTNRSNSSGNNNNNSENFQKTENSKNNSDVLPQLKDKSSQNYENENFVYSTTEDEGKKEREISSLTEQLKKAKLEIKLEKEKAHKALANLNKFYLERNKLEGIFNNCVEETKKIIFNRKVKENKGYKIKNKTGLGKYDYKVNYTAKFEDFLPTDKQSTLENFVFNDEVFNLIKETIFAKPKSNKPKTMENAKNLMSSYNFYDPDWKIKETVENAASNLPKKDENKFLALMNPNISLNNKNDKRFTYNSCDNQNNHPLPSLTEPGPVKDNKAGQGPFYKTGRMAINTWGKNQIGTTSKLTMNLQVS